MGFVVLGVLLILLKLFDIGPPGVWSWWVILAPFAMAVAWWTWADTTGYTKRREMDKMDERRKARRDNNMVSLGIDPRKYQKQSEKAAAYKAKRARDTDKIEGKRDAKRKKDRDSILSSRIDSHQNSSHLPSGRDSTGFNKR